MYVRTYTYTELSSYSCPTHNKLSRSALHISTSTSTSIDDENKIEQLSVDSLTLM